MKKIYTFGDKIGEKKPSDPKNGIWSPKAIQSYIHRSRMLCGARKKILLGVKEVKNSLQSPKAEFGAQNQYGCVIYPSIGNFT
jgi:hypothetical protein